MSGWSKEYIVGDTIKCMDVRCLCGNSVTDDSYDPYSKTFVCGKCGSISPKTKSMSRVERSDELCENHGDKISKQI